MKRPIAWALETLVMRLPLRRREREVAYQFAAPKDPWAPDAYDLIRAQVGEAGVPAPMADDLAQQMLDALRAHHDEENT